MSIKKIVQGLRPLQQITVNIAGHDHTAPDPLTETAKHILTATNTEGPTTKLARVGPNRDRAHR